MHIFNCVTSKRKQLLLMASYILDWALTGISHKHKLFILSKSVPPQIDYRYQNNFLKHQFSIVHVHELVTKCVLF